MRHVPPAAWGGSITGGRRWEASWTRDGGPKSDSGALVSLGPLSSPVECLHRLRGCPGSALPQEPGSFLSQLEHNIFANAQEKEGRVFTEDRGDLPLYASRAQ